MRTTSIGASLTATAAKASQGGALSNPRNDDPTNSAAIQCDLRPLDTAEHLFMERGFDVTSIDGAPRQRETESRPPIPGVATSAVCSRPS